MIEKESEPVFLSNVRSENNYIKAGGKTIYDRLNDSQLDDATRNENLTGVVGKAKKNAILGIDSLLQFPSDLGNNPRYNHFVVFHIYKSTSDEMDIDIRNTQRIESIANKSGIPKNIFNQVSVSSLAFFGNSENYSRAVVWWLIKGSEAPQFQSNPNSPEFQRSFNEDGDINNSNVDDWIAQNKEIYNSIKKAADIAYKENKEKISQYISNGNNSNDQSFTTPIAVNDITLNPSSLPLDNFFRLIKNSNNLPVDEAILQSLKNTVSEVLHSFESLSGKINDVWINRSDPNPANESQVNSRGRQFNKDNDILVAQRRFTTAKIRSMDTISLYMPNSIVNNDSVSHNSESFQAASIISSAIRGESGSLSALTNTFYRNVLGKLSDISGKLIGSDINADAVVSATLRTVPNPRRELILGEPQHRIFNFTFEMFPRSEEEANEIADIVTMFRYHQYPKLQNFGGHFYVFPSEFEIQFYMLQETIQEENGFRKKNLNAVVNGYLPRIGRCALTDVSVNYVPNNIWVSVGGKGAPVGTVLTLTFTEMQPLNKEHIVHGY
jgi:hypothetical protein